MRLVGAQLTEESDADVVRVRFEVCVPPFRLALSITISSAGTPVTEATNCALVWPVRTVTDPGVDTLALLSESETVALAAAAAVSETVQLALPAALKVLGEQLSELSELGAGAAKPNCMDRVTPLRSAVTVAIWPEATPPAVTTKLALLLPLPMSTLEGVVRIALSSLREMVRAPAAVLVKETVQVALCPLFKLLGVQLREDRDESAVKVRFAVCVPPFRLALIVAISSAGAPETEAENCAVLCPVRTVTEPGTETLPLLSESVTVALVAAAAVKLTVQVALPAALKVFGEQERELSALGAGAAKPICVLRVTPFKLAVTVAVCADAMLPAVTENVVLLAPPPMFTLAGVVKVALSSLRLMDTVLAAVLLKDTVQVELCPLFRLAGVQISDDKDAAAFKVKFAVWVPPFRLALSVTISSAGVPETEAENCALLCPVGTVTDPGTETLALLSESVTVALAAAAAVKLTVQVDVPAALKVFGEHDRELSTLGAGAAKPICELRVTPFKLAVTVAVCPEAMLPAVTVKFALLAPAPTFTLAGVVKVALSSLRPMDTVLDAVLFSETVQVELCPLFRLAGAQDKEDNAAGAVRVRVAFCVPPFRLALIVATSSADTLETEAANCTLLCPARMVTDPGSVTLALLSAKVTVAFAAAVAVRLTVQVAVPAALKLFGEQESALRTEAAGATSATCAVRVTPLRLAVTVAV